MPEDISVGEAYRAARDALQKIDTLPERFVLRREYDSDQRNIRASITEVTSDVGKTDAKVDLVQKQQAIDEKERQNTASARRWQIFMAFASPVAAAIVTILLIQGQTTP